jgi:hypothetical protein
MKKHGVIVIAAAALGVLASTGLARAQASTAPYVYSVKYLCGLQVVPSTQFPPPQEPPVKPGNYATAINIHNYHLKPTVFQRKSVVAGGAIGKLLARQILAANQAVTVGCQQIVAAIPPGTTVPPPFIEGFAEIVSPVQLSVTAVYTTQTCVNPGKCSELGSLSIEVVPQSAFRDQ